MKRKYARRSLLMVALCSMAMNCGADRATSLPAEPAIAGDHPDPSIIRVDADYWNTSTAAEWAPIFPLFYSTDLTHWELTGAVFPERPAWATQNFWAPEITADKGRYLVYYVGRKSGGPLCVAVATASKPSGPYTDKGPIVCQDDGSIDPVHVRDENNRPYLVWKNDGNSRQQPTYLWAQQLTEDGTQLIGQRYKLIVNDAPWEGNVIEGPYILRRNGWFYLFYSGGACCGRECNYAEGVARSRALLGPWQKNPANPILKGNDTWKCPGHGSLVTDPQGHTVFMYHSYERRGDVYLGRESLIDQVQWNNSGWPTINGGRGPGARPDGTADASTAKVKEAFADDFVSQRLDPHWQWPVDAKPDVRVGGGTLVLAASANNGSSPPGTMLVVPTLSADYVATAILSQQENVRAGLALVGDRDNAAGLELRNQSAVVWRRDEGKYIELAAAPIGAAQTVYLRVTASSGYMFRFEASTDGATWNQIGDSIDISTVPRWDRGLRVGLTASSGDARFTSFKVNDRK